MTNTYSCFGGWEIRHDPPGLVHVESDHGIPEADLKSPLGRYLAIMDFAAQGYSTGLSIAGLVTTLGVIVHPWDFLGPGGTKDDLPTLEEAYRRVASTRKIREREIKARLQIGRFSKTAIKNLSSQFSATIARGEFAVNELAGESDFMYADIIVAHSPLCEAPAKDCLCDRADAEIELVIVAEPVDDGAVDA